jgi:ParE toxin of type II toxin-antitoxin system, parDE
MAYVVSILPRAERDLESIFLYIQADSSRAAHEWFEGLIDATQTLSQHPQRNPAISENPTDSLFLLTLNMQAPKASDSPQHTKRGTAADLRSRLRQGWPRVGTENIFTPLNATYKGGTYTPSTPAHLPPPTLSYRTG